MATLVAWGRGASRCLRAMGHSATSSSASASHHMPITSAPTSFCPRATAVPITSRCSAVMSEPAHVPTFWAPSVSHACGLIVHRLMALHAASRMGCERDGMGEKHNGQHGVHICSLCGDDVAACLHGTGEGKGAAETFSAMGRSVQCCQHCHLICALLGAPAGASQCPTALRRAGIGGAGVRTGHPPSLTHPHEPRAAGCVHTARIQNKATLIKQL